MRVLFVSQEFPPETGWGGIGTYVAMVSEALSSRGVEVHVLSVAEGQPVSTRTLGGVTVHRRPLPVVRGPARFLPEAWSRLWLSATVARVVNGLKPAPTVIECPDWKAEGVGLALGADFPLVTRLHSGAWQIFGYSSQGRRMGGIDGQLAVWLEARAVRRANVVVSTQANLEENAERLNLDERAMHPIPAMVRLPSEVPYPNSAESPRVTFVGRLESRKAPDLVLRAVPRVLAAVPAARFSFVGRTVGDPAGPSSLASLQRDADRLGVAHAVEFHGGLDWEGVAEEMARASVCVFPSRWECFPNVTAEAAALGRPVVVSSISGFREMVEDDVTGKIVDGDRDEGWASAIMGLLLDPARAKAMGEAGSRLIRHVSDPDRLTALVIAAYEAAIERWKRGERAGRPRRRR